MKTRVTQSDVARAAGVHNTTVSLALRNSPAIPEATRRRIRALAEEMGYCPDPALQALVAYRTSRMTHRRQQTLAYVTHWNSRWGWQDEPPHMKCHQGAQQKAAQYGFQLEHFWFGEPGMTERRLGSMLFHRGITGVILAAHRQDGDALAGMDWSHLSAVRIGGFPHAPALHQVSYDQGGAVRAAMKRILAAGYRRVGLVLPLGWDAAADQAWSAGFFVEQARLPAQDRVPILCYTTPETEAPSIDEAEQPVEVPLLAKWMNRYRPEVIVSVAPFVLGPLRQLGLVVPRDVAYVDLLADPDVPALSGVRENCERVGEIAVEMLVAHLQQNVCGIPAVPTSTLVGGAWNEGTTLPPANCRSGWTEAACAAKVSAPVALASVA